MKLASQRPKLTHCAVQPIEASTDVPGETLELSCFEMPPIGASMSRWYSGFGDGLKGRDRHGATTVVVVARKWRSICHGGLRRNASVSSLTTSKMWNKESRRSWVLWFQGRSLQLSAKINNSTTTKHCSRWKMLQYESCYSMNANLAAALSLALDTFHVSFDSFENLKLVFSVCQTNLEILDFPGCSL